MPQVHTQYWGSNNVQPSHPDCLHGDDHGGKCYTLAERCERGFGDQFHCGNCECAASYHVGWIGKPAAPTIANGTHCRYKSCGCKSWVEPEDSPTDEELGRPMSVSESARHHVGRALTETQAGRIGFVQLGGVGPDAPTVTEANGAKQSSPAGAFTSVDPLVMFEIAQVQLQGDQKYGPDNWRGIPERDHINHALAHVYADLAGDEQDEHLTHAIVRLMFALAVRLRPEYEWRTSEDSE